MENAMPKIDPETVLPRYCTVCGFKLSAYNKTKTCFRHPDTETDEKKLPKNALPVTETSVIKPSAGTVMAAVCKGYRVTPQILMSADLRIRTARYVAMYLLYTDSHLSYKEVGGIFQRGFSAARYGYKYIDGLLRKKNDLLLKIHGIRALYDAVSEDTA